MKFHWQNLSQEDQPTPRPPLEGRCWLHFDDDERRVLRFAWSIPSAHGPSASLEVNGHGDGGIQIGLNLRAVAAWLSYERLPQEALDWLGLRYNGRQIRVSWNGEVGSLNWAFWTDPDSWSDGTPRWRDGWFNIVDLILGKAVHSEKVIDKVCVTVPMPEGPYPAEVTLKEATWRRPRWFPKHVRRADVDLNDNPIGVPGKGENSWDCGDDAIYEASVGASTISEAVSKVVEWALRDRLNYGGIGSWTWDKPPMPPRGERRAA